MNAVHLFVIATFLASPAVLGEVTPEQVKEYRKRLSSLLKGEHKKALQAFILEMAELDEADAVLLIPPAATRVASKENYDAALAAIRGLENPASIQALLSILEKKKEDFRHKMLVIDAFGRRKDEETLQVIVEQLSSRDPRLQIAATQAAIARRAREPIPELIRLLKEGWKERDRVWFEAREALWRLTGEDFDHFQDWEKFWDTVKHSFDPKKTGEREEGRTRVPTGRVKFFGSEIFSRNVIFVIDVSFSMIQWDEVERYRGRNIEMDRQRLARAKRQLALALKKMPDNSRFNIITFADTVDVWQRTLRPASHNNVVKALRFVYALEPSGFTHTDAALKRAFQDPHVDTIVLLSDGAPRKNRMTDSYQLALEILEWVEDANASRKIKIETFGFTGSGNWPAKGVPGRPGHTLPKSSPGQAGEFVEFLKNLSRDTGGRFRAIQ